MSELKAGQVWVRGAESFVLLWADGYNGIRAVEERSEQESHQQWLDRQPRFAASPVASTARAALEGIGLSDLIRDGWALDAEGREVSDE
tara:strand:+ start:6487 stop:6753 length:267 start_codon:yes stop_codon:yes gene_type:complete